jgi:type VI secretion system protein ImpL
VGFLKDVSPVLLLLVIAVTIVVIIALVLVLLWRTKKKQEAAAAASEADAPPAESEEPKPVLAAPPAHANSSVFSAIQFLSDNSSGSGGKYRTPWFMVVGASASGKSTMLDHSNISLSLREGATDFGVSQGVEWRFFDAGVILDVPGDLFMYSDRTGSEEHQWTSLLRSLQRHRPRRPIDGVVLTLPCTELIGDRAVSPAAIGQRAAQIFDKLWQIQKWTGICFPVYVVITKTDLIPGFQELVQQLPARYRREMFGWSNPYNVETAFDATWIDQAFDELAQSVNRLQSEVFVERQHIANVDDLFLLNARLQELRKPLRIYLGQIFKRSVYRESLQFRGFYFSGDAPEERELVAQEPRPARALAAAASASSSTLTSTSGYSVDEDVITGEILGLTVLPHAEVEHRAPVFVTDLFESKIFPEHGLARPVTRVDVRRNRTVVTAQVTAAVAAIVLTLGTWIGYRRLAEVSRTTVPLLGQVVNDLKAEQAPGGLSAESGDPEPHHAGETAEEEADHEEGPIAYNLIHIMQELTGHRFQSMFLPGSWMNPLDNRVRRAMTPAFERLVYSAFRRELVERLNHLLESTHSAETAAQSAATTSLTASIQQMPSYRQLRQYTTDLLLLEQNIDRYNRLATHGKGDPDSLIQLESYLHGHEVPAGFDDDKNPYFNAALMQATGKIIEITATRQVLASQKMRSLTADVYSQWVTNNPLVGYLDSLRGKINSLQKQELDSYAQLSELENSLIDADKLLSSPDLAWISQGTFDAAGPLDDVTLVPISKSKYLVPKEALNNYVVDTRTRAFTTLKGKLENEVTDMTGEMLDLQPALRLSDGTQKLRVVLANLLSLPFAQRDGAEEIRTSLSPQEELMWDKDLLQQAAGMKEAYDRFVAESLNNVPASMQATFEEVALGRLDSNIDDLIARAQSFQALPSSNDLEQQVEPEIQSFQAASASLNSLLQQFEDLDLTESHDELLNVTTKQAGHMLQRVDAAFDAQSPYVASSGFARWNQDNTPARAGFDVHNADEMKQYLTFQRQQVQQYANDASPMVSFLTPRLPAGREPARTVSKWSHILTDLQQYNVKAPGTPLGLLEDFISTDVDKATPENCQASFLTASVSASGDYFEQMHEYLRRSLHGRCVVLSEQNAVREYTEIANLFNEHLAGKFPFSAPPTEQLPSEADPQDVINIYKQLDTYGKSIRAGLDNGGFGVSQSRVSAFLSQMETLRPLFASLFSAEGDPAPALDFVPVFRVNQGRELNGNQIIDWTLQVGADTFHFRDPQRTGRWMFGQPVKLTLRWAKDSPEKPASVRGSGDSQLSSRSVVFEYRDSWSLLSMLALHQPRPNDFDRLVDPDPQTLVFEVADTKDHAPAGKTGADATPETRVFIRLKLRPPGKPDNLRVRTFPMEAPLPQETRASNSEGVNQ